MKITVCPKCGSKNIYQGTTGDGVLTGYTTKDVCRDCDYQGNPIIFDSEKEYKKFLKEFEEEMDIKEEKIVKERKKDVTFELSKKEKEVVEFLKELEEEEPDKDRTKGRKEEIIKEESGRFKNSITTLGAGLIIVGILVTAATLGMFIIYMGALILVGFILIIIGIASPKEQPSQQERSAKLTIGSILLMMSGVLSLYVWISVLYFDKTMIDPTIISQLTIWAIFGAVLSIFTIIGGIFAVKRKIWGIALLGGILGLYGFLAIIPGILSLIGLILVSISKKEFS